jgi:thioredoxin
MKEILNKQDFENILKEGKPVMLDFYADWCGPCQALLPRVEKLADQYQDDVIIAKVNVDKNRELSAHFGVRSIPALFFIRDNKVVDQALGLQSQSALVNKIEALKVPVNA